MRIGAVSILAVVITAIAALGEYGSAQAQSASIKSCGEKFDSRQQMLLEQRALGGDRAAQFELATCSWPLSSDGNSVYARPGPDATDQARENYLGKLEYGYVWSTLAHCVQQHDDLDEARTGLEKKNHISKRVRSLSLSLGLSGDKSTEREKLANIHNAVEDALLNEDILVKIDASRKFVSRLAGLGAPGLVQLGYMRSCPYYLTENSRHVQAALWQSAADQWADVVGTGKGDWSPQREFDRLFDDTFPMADERGVERFKEEYDLYDKRELIERLKYDAALANMGATPVEDIQLALGAFRDNKFIRNSDTHLYIDVPRLSLDNIYGELTSDLVQSAQCRLGFLRPIAVSEGSIFEVTSNGKEECALNGKPARATGWLTPRQTRDLICRAAAEREDAFSYLHLADMYYQGRGYPRDYDRALYAVQQARRLFNVGPTQVTSNIKDLAGRKDYLELNRQKAADLEQQIIADAEAYYGVVGAAAIAARLRNSNYGEPDVLCPNLPRLVSLPSPDLPDDVFVVDGVIDAPGGEGVGGDDE